MRSSIKRIEKYSSKLDSGVAKLITHRQEINQRGNFNRVIAKQVEIERLVKSIITGSASSMFNHFYCNFGKKAYQLSNKFKGTNLIKELEILDNIWVTRGLDPNLMRTIKEHIIPSYATFACCRFDMDNFDVGVFCG